MSSIIRAVDKVNKGVLILLGILLGIMSIVIIFQILSRFLLGIPLPWSEELARLIMAYTVFLGAALALRKHQLIAVEFISERLSPGNKKALKVFILVISIAFFVILFLKGIDMAGRVHEQKSAAMQLPMSVAYSCIPAGAVLLTMNAVTAILEMFTTKEGDM